MFLLNKHWKTKHARLYLGDIDFINNYQRNVTSGHNSQHLEDAVPLHGALSSVRHLDTNWIPQDTLLGFVVFKCIEIRGLDAAGIHDAHCVRIRLSSRPLASLVSLTYSTCKNPGGYRIVSRMLVAVFSAT